MCYLRVQRLFQVLQDGTGSNDATLQVVDAKALQRLHVEVLEQFLVGSLLGKYPVVEFESHEPIAKIALEVVLTPSVVEHLLGLEVAYQLLHIVVSALAYQKLACRDIQEADATRRLAKMHSTEEVVFLVVQHRILHGHTGRHEFRNTAFYQLFSQLGVFQLVADGHTFACSDEFGQIGVQRMMRKASHLVALVVAIITVCQRNTQDARGNDGVFAVRLVEVATTKQQQGLRIFCLEVEELFHHRRQFAIFLCHLSLIYSDCKGTKKERNSQEFRSFIISNLVYFCINFLPFMMKIPL